jgi:hypothetical protein
MRTSPRGSARLSCTSGRAHGADAQPARDAQATKPYDHDCRFMSEPCNSKLQPGERLEQDQTA